MIHDLYRGLSAAKAGSSVKIHWFLPAYAPCVCALLRPAVPIWDAFYLASPRVMSSTCFSWFFFPVVFNFPSLSVSVNFLGTFAPKPTQQIFYTKSIQVAGKDFVGYWFRPIDSGVCGGRCNNLSSGNTHSWVPANKGSQSAEVLCKHS